MLQQSRVVLLTGANRGIGLELAKHLAEKQQFKLILTSRCLENGEQAKTQILARSPKADVVFLQLDLLDTDSIKAFPLQLLKHTDHIDVLVNNAAMIDKEQYKFGTDGKNVLACNFINLVQFTETLLPYLSEDAKVYFYLKKTLFQIVNVSSDLSRIANFSPLIQKQLQHHLNKEELLQMAQSLMDGNLQGWKDAHYPYYSASKALMNAYSRYILNDLIKSQQSIFNIHPGWVKSDMGGPYAPLELKNGIVSCQYVIEAIPFGRDPKYHGQMYDEQGNIWTY